MRLGVLHRWRFCYLFTFFFAFLLTWGYIKRVIHGSHSVLYWVVCLFVLGYVTFYLLHYSVSLRIGYHSVRLVCSVGSYLHTSLFAFVNALVLVFLAPQYVHAGKA